MQERLLADRDGLRTFVLVMETGDAVMAKLHDFANRHDLKAGQFSGIGAFSDAVLKYFAWEQKKYLDNPVKEQVELPR
jgi:predicted DNA-binding protein with PD1-like motif